MMTALFIITSNNKAPQSLNRRHPVAEPGCVHRGGQGGASNQPGVAQKSSLFQYKNVFDYKVLDYFSA